MTFRRFGISIVIGLLLLSGSRGIAAAEIDIHQLIERIERLETETEALKAALLEALAQNVIAHQSDELVDDKLADLQHNVEHGTKVGGYVDIEYRDSDAAGSVPSTRLHHLSLFFTKQFDNRFRFFSEIEFEDAPVFSSAKDAASFKAKNGKIFLEAVNLTFAWKPELGFRVGRFFTPIGIWSEDHYPPFVVTQERPLIIRKIFPQLVDGLSARGSLPLGDGFVSYDVFAGNGEGNTGKRDENSNTAKGLRVRYEMPGRLDTTIGIDAYDDRLNDGVRKSAWGMHGKLRYGLFSAQTEWAKAKYDNPAGQDSTRDGYYLQLQATRSDWTWGVRHDRFNEEENLVDSRTVRNTAFLNYRYSPETVVKLEYHETNLDGISNVGSYVISVASFLGL